MNGKSQPGTISRPLKAKQTSTAQHLLDCNPKSPNTPASNAKYSTNLARFWNEVRKFRVETGKFCETVNIFIAGEPFQAKAVWPCPGFLVLEQYPKSINMSRLNYSILKLIKIDLNLTVRLCSPCLAFLVLQNPPDLEALLGGTVYIVHFVREFNFSIFYLAKFVTLACSIFRWICIGKFPMKNVHL